MGLHRPYIRKDVRAEVEGNAQKNENGQFLDVNTGKAIDGPYDLGHKPGHEFRTEKAKAEQEGITQKQFNDRMNDPSLYQIEDPSSNRSHQFEMKDGHSGEDADSSTSLHRPYIRNNVRSEVESHAIKNENHHYLDRNTGKPLKGQTELGHKPGQEFRTEKEKAENEGVTQERFNDRMNNPDYYQVDDPSSNRSQKFEEKGADTSYKTNLTSQADYNGNGQTKDDQAEKGIQNYPSGHETEKSLGMPTKSADNGHIEPSFDKEGTGNSMPLTAKQDMHNSQNQGASEGMPTTSDGQSRGIKDTSCTSKDNGQNM